MFTQLIDPLDNLTLTCLVALVPVVSLLVMLAVFRLPAWLATLIGSIITFALALWVWRMPLDDGGHAYLYGAATGVWNVDWITIWGMVLFNTLGVSGVFENFRRWLIALGGMDVRVQTMLFAWAFGALLEGLVGFGYPWAVVAPILVTLAIPEIDAIRVAAIANTPPASYGPLGVPSIALAPVTGYSPPQLPPSVGHAVSVLWTGPWSPLPKVTWFKAQVAAISSVTQKEISAAFSFTPFIGGTAILVSWIIVAALLRPGAQMLKEVFRRTFQQMWGALLV